MIKIITKRNKIYTRIVLMSLVFVLILSPAIIVSLMHAPKVKADSLLGLNEGGGTTIHDTNGNVVGTLGSALWKTKDDCQTGNCLYFDGTGDYVSFGNDSSVDFTTGSFTLEGWFRTPDITSGTRVLISKYNSATGTDGGYKVYMDSNGYLIFGIDNDQTGFPSDSASTSTTVFDDNQWHHFAAVKTATTSVAIYVDGYLYQTDSSITASSLTNTDGFYVGIDGDGTSNGFSGFMDEIKIYSSARTAAEISSDKLGVNADRGTSAKFSPDDSYVTDGLVGYWKMDESSGDAVDSSGNSNTLTNNSATPFTNAKFSSGAEFDGSTDFFDMADNAVVSLTGSITLSAWIIPDTVTGDHAIIGKFDGAGESYLLLQTTDEIRMYIDSSSSYATTTTANLIANTTYHVVGVYNAVTGTVMLYVNGVVQATSTTGTIPTGIGNDTGEFSIGAEDTGGTAANYFDGHIDDARLYNRDFSAAEVASLYSWSPAPIAYWNMDHKSGSPQISANMLVYRQSTDDTPIYRRHEGNMNSMENAALDVDSEDLYDIEWVRIAAKPSATSDEKILCTKDSGDDLNCQVWSGTWGSLNEFTTNAGANKGFDVAYESTSGRGMVCYMDATVDSSIPYCDIWNGSNFGTPADANDVTSIINNIRLIPDPNSNYIAMMTLDQQDDINVQIWNGSSWGNLQEVETDTSTNNLQIPYDGAWDTSGDFMVVWYSNPDGELEARQFDKTNLWGSQIDGVATGLAVTGDNAYVQVSAHPYNGQMVAVVADTDDTIEASFWNGSAWGGQSQLENSLGAGTVTTNDTPLDIAYERSGDYDAIVTYGETSSTLKYRVFDTATSSWGSEQNLPTSTDAGVDWHQLSADPYSERIMITLLGSVDAVDTLEWNGSVWEPAFTNQEGTSDDTISNVWFAYDYQPDYPSDRSGNNLGGRMDLTMKETDWKPGKFGESISVNGGDYVSIDDYAALDFTGDFTVSVWTNRQESFESGYIISKSNFGSDGGYAVLISVAGAVYCRTGNGTGFDDSITADGIINDFSGWHHVAVARSGASCRVYVDGVDQTSTVGTHTTLVSNDNTIKIGTRPDLNIGYYAGYVDDMKIYNYSRRSDQIITDMNGGHPPPGSPVGSAVAYWNLDEGHSTSANDQSINANTLSLSSASWSPDGKYQRAFKGTGGGVRMSRSTDADLEFSTTDSFSISLWFKSNTDGVPAATEYLVADGGPAGSAGYAVYLNTSGNVCFGIDDDASWGPDVASCSPGDVYDAQWHHVIGVRNVTTDTTELYLDGKLYDSDSDTTSATLDSNPTFYVGDMDADDAGSGEEFAGLIDEIKVFRTALTADQVKVEANHGAGMVIGSLSTDSDGKTASNSASRSHCVPGDTTSCTGPVGEWLFDENTGSSSFDTSGNNKTLMLSHNSWSTGKMGSAFKATGTTRVCSGSGSCADDDFFDVGTSSFTFSLWYRSSTDVNPSSQQFVLAKRLTESTIGYQMVIGTNGKIVFQIDDDTTFEPDDSVGNIAAVSETYDARWHHVAAVKSGTSSVALYIDGVLRDSKDPITATGSLSNTSMFVLADRNGVVDGNEFSGDIDQFRMYNYALSASQVAWDYDRGAPVLWYKMDECTGALVNDSMGKISTGTITAGGVPNSSTGSCSTGPGSEMWGDGQTGKYNGSLGFDGTDDVVEVSSNTIFDAAEQTWSLWIKTDGTWNTDGGDPGTHDRANILSRIDSSSSLNGVSVLAYHNDTGGIMDITLKDGSGIVAEISGTTDITNDQWHHIAVTFSRSSGATARLYVDGKLEGSAVLSGSFSFNSQVIRIGDPLDSFWEEYEGLVDDVRMYNYQLTQNQINLVMNAGAAARF